MRGEWGAAVHLGKAGPPGEGAELAKYSCEHTQAAHPEKGWS